MALPVPRAGEHGLELQAEFALQRPGRSELDEADLAHVPRGDGRGAETAQPVALALKAERAAAELVPEAQSALRARQGQQVSPALGRFEKYAQARRAAERRVRAAV